MGAEALNERQKRFCEEYIACKFNGTQAAINAGYSEKTSAVIAAENLTKLNIQAYLSELIAADSEKVGVTKERVIREYARVAFNDIRKYYDENGRLLPINELDDDAAAALAGVEVDELWGASLDGKIQIGETKKIKRWDKVKALDSLGKYLGLFEKDNEQKKPVVNVSTLPSDELKQLEALLSKANAG